MPLFQGRKVHGYLIHCFHVYTLVWIVPGYSSVSEGSVVIILFGSACFDSSYHIPLSIEVIKIETRFFLRYYFYLRQEAFGIEILHEFIKIAFFRNFFCSVFIFIEKAFNIQEVFILLKRWKAMIYNTLKKSLIL